MNITVYLGSTPGKNPVFLEAAEEVGSLIGMSWYTAVQTEGSWDERPMRCLKPAELSLA